MPNTSLTNPQEKSHSTQTLVGDQWMNTNIQLALSSTNLSTNSANQAMTLVDGTQINHAVTPPKSFSHSFSKTRSSSTRSGYSIFQMDRSLSSTISTVEKEALNLPSASTMLVSLSSLMLHPSLFSVMAAISLAGPQLKAIPASSTRHTRNAQSFPLQRTTAL